MDLNRFDFGGNHRRKDELVRILSILPENTFSFENETSSPLKVVPLIYRRSSVVTGIEISGKEISFVRPPEDCKDLKLFSEGLSFRYQNFRYVIHT